MQTKLTLRLEEGLIEKAKAYSKRTGKSVSRLVADYFTVLEAVAASDAESLPPKTRSLLGALSGASLDEADYRDHLESKYR